MVCSDDTKKFWGTKLKSLSGTVQIEITCEILSGRKIPKRALIYLKIHLMISTVDPFLSRILLRASTIGCRMAIDMENSLCAGLDDMLLSSALAIGLLR